MRQPKTLHLTNFYHGSFGGISAFYNALLRCANYREREMSLVAPGEADYRERVGPFGKIHYVKSPHSPWVDRRYRLIFPLGHSGREVLRILMEEQPDILEVSDKYTLPYISGMIRKHMVRGAGRPTEIATSHERMDDNFRAHVGGHRAGQWFVRFYLRFIYFSQFDHHIANSAYTADELVPASKGHSTRRGIWVTPMGVDAHFFEPRPSPRQFVKRLIYAGRIAKEKNIDLLMDTIELLPERYRLVIAGEGPQKERFLSEAARRIPGRLEMHDHIANRHEYAELLQSADVFAHPNPASPSASHHSKQWLQAWR